MANYLIDTHIFLWLCSDYEKINSSIRDKIVEAPRGSIYFSYASAWEIAIKHATGKLHLPETPETFILRRVKLAGFQFLPIELSHIFTAGKLPDIHKDPFDRLLLAQVKTEKKMTFITADATLARYDIPVLVTEQA